MVGSADCPLEDKMVTIAYGIDMVNISYISFAATTKAIAQVCRRINVSLKSFNGYSIYIVFSHYSKTYF